MKYITVLAVILAVPLLFGACSVPQPVKKDVPFSVRLDSPKISAGSFEAQFEKLVDIGELRKANVIVDYYPLDDAVCLQYRLDFMTYYLFWDRNARDTFVKALDRYKEDYDQRNLQPKGNKKTKTQYDNVEAYLIWQAAKYMVRSFTPVNIGFGYYIRTVSKNRVAFFTIYQPEAIFIDEMSKNEKRESNVITMYLSKMQGDILAGLFDQNFLKGLSGGVIENRVNILDAY
jgi:hypothetical protein